MKETRERIVIKALQYFVENDYESVSLNSIAEGIGITKGGIYHYFGSKDELFKECINAVFKTMEDFSLMALDESAGPEDVLRALFSFRDIMQLMAESLKIESADYLKFFYLVSIGVKKFPVIGESMTMIYKDMQQGLEQIFEEYRNKGLVRNDLNTRAFSFELIALIEGTMLVASFNTDIDLDEIGADLISSFLDRIKP